MNQPNPKQIAQQVERIRLARRKPPLRNSQEAQKQFDEFARTPATIPQSSRALSLTLNGTAFSTTR